MRATVLRGFCIRPQVYAQVGQVVDLPEAFFRELAARGSVEPAPEPTPRAVAEEPASAPADPADAHAKPAASKPIHKSKS